MLTNTRYFVRVIKNKLDKQLYISVVKNRFLILASLKSVRNIMFFSHKIYDSAFCERLNK